MSGDGELQRLECMQESICGKVKDATSATETSAFLQIYHELSTKIVDVANKKKKAELKAITGGVVKKPITTKPSVAKPVTDKPATIKPATKPATAKPTTSKPTTTKTKPAAAEPAPPAELSGDEDGDGDESDF